MSTKKIVTKTNNLRARSRSPLKSPVTSKRLLISNIPFTTSLNDLRDVFKSKIGICGKLDFIERNGRFSGNAIMEFKTLEGAQKAVDNLHKHEINGREIIVREETLKDRHRLNLDEKQSGNMLPIIQSDSSLNQLVNDIDREGPITSSIFIANLDYSMTWQKLKDLFKAAGRVRHVELKTDEEGKSRGFGTIEFETPEEAILAIHMFNNKAVGKREIRLRIDKSGKPLSGRLDLSRFVDTTNFAPSNISNNLNPQVKRLFEDILGASSKPGRKNPQALKALDELMSLAKMFDKPPMQQRLGVNMSHQSDFDGNYGFGGMPPTRQWNNDMSVNNSNGFGGEDYFPAQNIDASFINGRGAMMSNKPVGGYPDFSSNSGRIPRDYQPINPRPMDFNENPKNPSNDMSMIEDMLIKMKNSGNLDQTSLMNVISNVIKRNPNDSFMSTVNSYSNQRSSDDFLIGRSPSTLLIKNIPFSYTWKDLKISFSQVGGIEQIEILRDDFNRSKGVGVVRFQSPSDAMRCKNLMDGTLLDGRPIHIEFSNQY